MAPSQYKVTSPIKYGGKRREEGEVVEMTAEQAEGLHVEPTQSAANTEPAGKGSGSGSAQTDPESLEGIRARLEKENKGVTEELCRKDELPEEEWASLKKADLIDFYLNHLEAKAQEAEAES